MLAATAAASQEATPGVPTSEFAFRPDLPDSDLDNDLPNCEMTPTPSGENLDLKHQISVISSQLTAFQSSLAAQTGALTAQKIGRAHV